MAESSAAEGVPVLRTVILTLSVPETVLARFRAEFPALRFVVLGEETAGDEGFAYAPASSDPDVLRDADGLIGWSLDAETLADAPRLRWMHAASAGVERYDFATLAERGIMLTNSRGVCAPNMAEHVLGMMLALARRIPRLVQAQTQRAWRDFDTHAEVVELQGQTVLIVGLGEIGRAVATRAAAFDMRVQGVRRRETAAPPGVERVFPLSALHDALSRADHVVLTLPNTPRTRGLFDAAAFAAMKPGALIYNVGRGPVIDTAALTAALESGHLGGAGLDVTDPEPLPEQSPLWGMDNVLITAHTSGATPRWWERQANLIVDTIRHIERGERPSNLVDLAEGY